MKKIITSTLVLSLLILAFGGIGINAQGINNPNKPVDVDSVRTANLTYQKLAQNNIDILNLSSTQKAEFKVILNEYFNERNELIDELNYNKNELRRNMYTIGITDKDNALMQQVVDDRNQLEELKNQYKERLRSVFNEVQINTIENEQYVLNIGSSRYSTSFYPTNYNELPMYGTDYNRFRINTNNQTVFCRYRARSQGM